jgi:phosphoglycerol transferase MdoB-like AlkP superfamily enzyme
MAVGDLLSALDAHDLLEKTVLVIYGDHTSSLVDEPLALLRNRSASFPLDRFLVRKRLPLFVRIPGGPTGSVNTPGGHIDVAPTILHLAGLDDSNTYMLGKDLLSQQSRLVVFRDGSFINGSHVLFNAIGPTSTATCYELERGVEVDCGLLSHDRQRAMRQLEASDALVRGNGIPVLDAHRMTALQRTASK